MGKGEGRGAARYTPPAELEGEETKRQKTSSSDETPSLSLVADKDSLSLVADKDSLSLVADKDEAEFRDYSADGKRAALVREHYQDMRTNQTLAFHEAMQKKYDFTKPRMAMTIKEAFEKLETYVDASDPDLALPNLVHMLQTAEGIKKAGNPDWMQLVGLLHDMGKVMFLFGDDSIGQGQTKQWALGGDTYVVGCRIPDKIVFPEFNKLNVDMEEGKVTSTPLGIYEAGCGLSELKFAYGHDEYMYQMLVANNATIPKEGLAMIRYHSCYTWHTEGNYKNLTKPEDEDTKKWVIKFNQFDLYTKDEENELDIKALWPYYEGLVHKYLGDKKLNW